MEIPWRVKSSIFKCVDLFNLPSLLYILQKYVTRRSRITSLSINENWTRHGNAIKKYNAGGLVFEFGAGKSLAQNLYLSNIVINQVVVDLNPMMDLDLVNAARGLLADQCELKSDNEIHSIDDLARYGIEYRAPYDASNTDFEDNSLDACISTNTLEHISKEGIVNIFRELRRTLKKEGIVSAKIDYSDHYAHTDSSISLLNYLRFSEKDWRMYNHSCHYQNRMRHYDYLRIFEDCGFIVVEEEITYAEDKIPREIAEMFDNKPETWAATSAYILLMKK